MCIPLCHALGPPSPLGSPHRCGVLQETHTAGPSTSVIKSACPHPLRTLQSGLASGTEYSTCPKAPLLGGDGGAAARPSLDELCPSSPDPNGVELSSPGTSITCAEPEPSVAPFPVEIVSTPLLNLLPDFAPSSLSFDPSSAVAGLAGPCFIILVLIHLQGVEVVTLFSSDPTRPHPRHGANPQVASGGQISVPSPTSTIRSSGTGLPIRRDTASLTRASPATCPASLSPTGLSPACPEETCGALSPLTPTSS